MSLSLYEGGRRSDPIPLIIVQALNLAFAAACIFMWAMLSFFIEDPIRWATSTGIGSRPELLDYPFVLLWLLPVVGACAAWVAQQAKRMKLAYFLAGYPLAYLGLMVAWYYLAPAQWL